MRKTIAVALSSLVLTFGGVGVVAAEPLEQPQPTVIAQNDVDTDHEKESDKTGLWGLLGLLGLLGLGGLAKRNKDTTRYDSTTTPRRPA
ncbi:WGxxGxxG family protein [Nocardia testacea]|uniref:WGxxGxxG family protein n=1 Tax=Nocardia testacea TaxID=248551 RepID=A0ABW7VWT6_9NOCA